MKTIYVNSLYLGEKFQSNGKNYAVTDHDQNMVEAWDFELKRFTCFWCWTKVTKSV